jgi:hypothetical protein
MLVPASPHDILHPFGDIHDRTVVLEDIIPGLSPNVPMEPRYEPALSRIGFRTLLMLLAVCNPASLQVYINELCKDGYDACKYPPLNNITTGLDDSRNDTWVQAIEDALARALTAYDIQVEEQQAAAHQAASASAAANSHMAMQRAQAWSSASANSIRAQQQVAIMQMEQQSAQSMMNFAVDMNSALCQQMEDCSLSILAGARGDSVYRTEEQWRWVRK